MRLQKNRLKVNERKRMKNLPKLISKNENPRIREIGQQ